MPELYRIIPFNRNCGSCGGSLVQFQPGDTEVNALPFQIGKVLVTSGIRADDVRGHHAHHATEEIVVALSGGCTFELDDGRGTSERVRLSASDVRDQRSEVRDQRSEVRDQRSEVRDQRSEDGGRKTEDGGQRPEDGTPSSVVGSQSSEIKALLLFPHVWRTFRDFEPETVLLIVANMKYDEKDYIRDRAEFERLAKTWTGLGGSAER